PGLARELPRGNRLLQRLDRCRPAARTGAAAGEEWLRPVPARPGRAGPHRMKIVETGLTGCVVIEPAVFGDERGFFYEGWNAERFGQHGLPTRFVQHNVSRSQRGVL